MHRTWFSIEWCNEEKCVKLNQKNRKKIGVKKYILLASILDSYYFRSIKFICVYSQNRKRLMAKAYWAHSPILVFNFFPFPSRYVEQWRKKWRRQQQPNINFDATMSGRNTHEYEKIENKMENHQWTNCRKSSSENGHVCIISI